MNSVTLRGREKDFRLRRIILSTIDKGIPNHSDSLVREVLEGVSVGSGEVAKK
jgi:hypothetical protein